MVSGVNRIKTFSGSDWNWRNRLSHFDLSEPRYLIKSRSALLTSNGSRRPLPLNPICWDLPEVWFQSTILRAHWGCSIIRFGNESFLTPMIQISSFSHKNQTGEQQGPTAESLAKKHIMGDSKTHRHLNFCSFQWFSCDCLYQSNTMMTGGYAEIWLKVNHPESFVKRSVAKTHSLEYTIQLAASSKRDRFTGLL